MRFKPGVRSRHNTHLPLRTSLSLLPFRAIVRLGSTTTNEQYNRERVNRKLPAIRNLIECNTVNAVKNSSNKLLMKRCFTESEVKTADWWTTTNGELFLTPNLNTDNCQSAELPYPIVAKHIFGSRGTGNSLLKTNKELTAFLAEHRNSLGNYIFEKFYNYSKEYRLHVTEDGCFYTCRKMLKDDTADEHRWYRNDSNCVWILENNPLFAKPSSWGDIVAESVKALKAVGLDIGAIDVKVQSQQDSRGRAREYPEFVILETNSAPSFGEITLQKYLQQIPIVLNKKRIS